MSMATGTNKAIYKAKKDVSSYNPTIPVPFKKQNYTSYNKNEDTEFFLRAL